MAESARAVPGYLPEVPPAAMPEVALDLYRQIARATRRAEDAEGAANERIAEHRRATDRTLAALAAERFEFDRLVRRITPDLERLGGADTLYVIDLFSRAWRASLAREGIEVRDLTGVPLTPELAALVEVNAAIPDPEVAETVIRQTLTPLVLHQGRVVGVAVVITAVPPEPSSPPEPEMTP